MNPSGLSCIDSSEVTTLKSNRTIFCAASLAGLLILILDGKTALSGASQGIELCIRTVIPSLFPFFFLSGILTNSLSGSSCRILAPVRARCAVPRGVESILITGFLGGYPVGAKSIGDAYTKNDLHPQDAAHLLSFCSNAGPSFLFGMISGLFQESYVPFLLWAIHIISAILVSVIHPSGPCQEVPAPTSEKHLSISDILRATLAVMAVVCGWVILFRVLITFLNRWFLWALPEILRILITGFLELTNGCCELASVPQPGLRFVLCSVFLAFGGICVTMQTASVVSGVSMRHYLAGKLMQTLFSLLLSISVVLQIGVPVLLFLILFAVLLGKIQKRSGNPLSVGV